MAGMGGRRGRSKHGTFAACICFRARPGSRTAQVIASGMQTRGRRLSLVKGRRAMAVAASGAALRAHLTCRHEIAAHYRKAAHRHTHYAHFISRAIPERVTRATLCYGPCWHTIRRYSSCLSYFHPNTCHASHLPRPDASHSLCSALLYAAAAPARSCHGARIELLDFANHAQRRDVAYQANAI